MHKCYHFIFSIPFEFFLFQKNFEISRIIINNFVSFWTLPCSLCCNFYLSYYLLHFSIHVCLDMEIKPEEFRWPLVYYMEKKKLPGTSPWANTTKVFISLLIFCLGFIYTLPLSPFMMIHGEANE